MKEEAFNNFRKLARLANFLLFRTPETIPLLRIWGPPGLPLRKIDGPYDFLYSRKRDLYGEFFPTFTNFTASMDFTDS